MIINKISTSPYQNKPQIARSTSFGNFITTAAGLETYSRGLTNAEKMDHLRKLWQAITSGRVSPDGQGGFHITNTQKNFNKRRQIPTKSVRIAPGKLIYNFTDGRDTPTEVVITNGYSSSAVIKKLGEIATKLGAV